MAIVSIPLLGQASGKMSTFEFFRISGKNYIRSSKLKRYKTASASQLEKQLLIKKIVSSITPLIPFMRSSLFVKRASLNFFNAWIKKYYHNFYLNESGYLFCDDYLSFQFSIQSFLWEASFVISSYSKESIILDYTSSIDLLSADYAIIAIFATTQFRKTCYYMPEINIPDSGKITITYNTPPLNSQDYSCLMFLWDITNNIYSNTLHAFSFSH